ncbi:bifunctional RNase H/acid phosphatase [Streptomyces sp. G45]|uniref:bifunctional RNase H/acid phosphatase n=1 Tax=Streptomyces sp. G45 TaxID=3406627 RepID=UPI003C138C26
MREFIVEADGGSRGNPGPAGYGSVVIDAASGETLAETAEYVGVATNNVAEYKGLIAGLRAAYALDPAAAVRVRMDSKLVVEQMSGRWKIKHPDMKPLAAEAARIFPAAQVTYEWIPRERNKHADRLANEAMDAGKRGEAWSPSASTADLNAAARTAATPTGPPGDATAGAARARAALAGRTGGAAGAAGADDAAGAGGPGGADGAAGRGSTAGSGAADAASAAAVAAGRAAFGAGAAAAARGANGGADLEGAATGRGAFGAGGAGERAGAGADVRGAGPVADGQPGDAAGAAAAARGTNGGAAGAGGPAAGAGAVAVGERGSAEPQGPASAGERRGADARAAGVVAGGGAARDTAAPPVGWAAPADLGAPATFVLLRHGETPLTPQKRFSGSGGSDPSLSDIGREQAVRVAAALAARGTVQAVVSSPLRRCQETARTVAARLGLDVRVEDGLRETDFGQWEGLTFAEVRERQPDELTAWLASPNVAPPGGESFAEVTSRVSAARDRLLAAYAGRTVLLVTHVTPIKTLVRLALGAPPEALFRMELAAASLSAVAYYADGNASVRLLNDTAHLR